MQEETLTRAMKAGYMARKNTCKKSQQFSFTPVTQTGYTRVSGKRSKKYSTCVPQLTREGRAFPALHHTLASGSVLVPVGLAKPKSHLRGPVNSCFAYWVASIHQRQPIRQQRSQLLQIDHHVYVGVGLHAFLCVALQEGTGEHSSSSAGLSAGANMAAAPAHCMPQGSSCFVGTRIQAAAPSLCPTQTGAPLLHVTTLLFICWRGWLAMLALDPAVTCSGGQSPNRAASLLVRYTVWLR